MSTSALYLGRDWSIEHDQRVKVSDAELRYTVQGSGEPVLLIHCTSIADGLITPLLKFYPQLLDEYQFISYYRAGYNGSTLEKSSLTIEEMAEHANQVLDHLGIEKAHVISYSFGGVIGFQYLLSHPERVQSAVLLEPYLPREEPESAQANLDAVLRGLEVHNRGDKLKAATQFMAEVCGPSYLSSVELTCPLDVWDKVEECADTTFLVDFAALGEWKFRMSEADSFVSKKPDMPVLAVTGEDSEAAMPGFRETQRFLVNWLPQADRAGIIGASHGLQIMNPVPVAQAIQAFLRKHPIA